MSNPKKVGGGQYNFYRLLIIIECRIYEKNTTRKKCAASYFNATDFICLLCTKYFGK